MRFSLAAAAAAIAALAVGGSAAAVDPNPADGPANPHFVEMEPVVTPIMGPARIEGALEVKLVLETGSAADATTLGVQMPELREASYFAALEFSRLYASGYLPVDASRLAKDVTTAIQRSHPQVSRVLIASVSAMPA